MKQIINANIVTSTGVEKNKVLVFSDVIEEIRSTPIDGIETVDAEGNFIIPGFIDLHIHGYGGADVMDCTEQAIETISQGILKNGVTAFLPTSMTVSYEALEKAFDCTRKVANRQKNDSEYAKKGARVLGIHAEGPFINMEKKGAQNGEYIKVPDFGFVKKHADIVKMITIAPETDENFETIKKIASETDVVISAGHTCADYDTMLKAIDAGVRHGTHLFNAMSSISHRAPGGTGALLFSDKVSCELICDGVHVHPAWFEPVFRLKGAKLNLITDCLRACGLPDGQYELGGQTFDLKGVECRLADGTIAGSVIKLNRAVFNLHKAGVPLHEAVNCASLYPAMTLGLQNERGEIKAGLLAEFSICTPELEIIRVFH